MIDCDGESVCVVDVLECLCEWWVVVVVEGDGGGVFDWFDCVVVV